MALFPPLRRQSNRGHPAVVAEADGLVLSELGRITGGGATLFTDANTTSVTMGGGAALSALLDLSSTNPSTIRSHAGQALQLNANGAAALDLITNTVTRISIQSGGGVRIGASTTATGVGDLSVGDGTRELIYDASAGGLTISGLASGDILDAVAANNGIVRARISNTNAGTGARAVLYLNTDTNGMTFQGMGSGFTTQYPLVPDTGLINVGAGMDALRLNSEDGTVVLATQGDGVGGGADRLTVVNAGGVRVGASTSATDPGDLSTGDGTRDLFFDASTAILLNSGTFNGRTINRVTNANGGAAAQAEISFVNDTSSAGVTLPGSGFTPALNGVEANWATMFASSLVDGMRFVAVGDGAPIAFGNSSAGNFADRWTIDTFTNGSALLPGADATYDIGSGSLQVRDLYLSGSIIGPGGSSEELLATVASIDATATGTTALYTATATTIITKVILLCTAASGITTEATAGVGIAAGEDDMFPSELLAGLDVADKAFTYLAAGARVVATNTDTISLGIDTAATGTSQTLTAYIFGYPA